MCQRRCVAFLLLIAFLKAVQCQHQLCPIGYQHGQYVDGKTEKFLLCWKVDWRHKRITFSTRVATTGWIGLGFSPTGYMPNSDVMIGWVKDGEGYLNDRFATGRTRPPIDGIQNVELLSFSEADGWTSLEVRRKLAACESNDRNIEEGTTRVIFSYSPNDPDSEDSFDQHTFAGRASISLLSGTGEVEAAPLESDHRIIDLLNPNVTVPTRLTTYWCVPFILPQLTIEAHIIKLEPIIQENHEEVVHHIVLYECTDDIKPYVNISWDCDHPPRHLPRQVTRCRGMTVIAAWAIGGTGISFPQDVGLPLSGSTGTQYVVMETHYNNPHRYPNYVDKSGFRIYYTPTKRRYDGGLLLFGHSLSPYGVELVLPPGMKDVVMENVCPRDCTQAGLPPDGVTVFASFLHTHTIGKAVQVRHVRNGTELPYIDKNMNYDFDFQDFVLLTNEVKILPGDEIQVQCDYDTSHRTNVTLGGEATTDEMCVVFLVVYPKPRLATCLSNIPFSVLLRYAILASNRGFFVYNGNRSDDDATQLKQFAKDLKKIDFSSDGSRRLWSDWYWSSNKREYSCMNTFEGDLLEDDYLTTLPVITKALAEGAGIIGSCLDDASAASVISDSAPRFVCKRMWMWLFLAFVISSVIIG